MPATGAHGLCLFQASREPEATSPVPSHLRFPGTPGRSYLGIEMYLGHEGAREEGSPENGINLTSVCGLPPGANQA